MELDGSEMAEPAALAGSRDEDWQQRARRDAAAIGVVAFFMNFVPSEPFLTKYLVEERGVSTHELDTLVWPTDTYANFVFLLPVGILAETWGYRRTVLLGLVARQATRVILLFGVGVRWMMAMQVTYAFQSACNTVFFAFALSLANRKYQSQMAAIAMASYHVGNVFGSALGQILVDSCDASLRSLFFVSWFAQIITLVLFVFVLPKQRRVDSCEASADNTSLASLHARVGPIGVIKESCRLFNTMQLEGLLWCIWWIFGVGSSYIFGNWYQELVLELNPNAKFGLIEIGLELSQSIGAAFSGFAATLLYDVIRMPNELSFFLAELGLVLLSTAGVILLDLLVAYAGSSSEASLGMSLRMLVFGFAESYSQAAIAKSLKQPLYAIIFTWNTFFSLSFMSFLTTIGSNAGWTVHSWFMALIALGFTSMVALVLVSGCFLGKRCCTQHFTRLETDEA